MAEPREPILPDGISDLYDLVQRKEEAERKLRAKISTISRFLVPILIEKLSLKIDYDVLSAEEKDIVLPLIREAAVEEIQRITGTACDDLITSRILDSLTGQIWRAMLHQRKNPVYGNLSVLGESRKPIFACRVKTQYKTGASSGRIRSKGMTFGDLIASTYSACGEQRAPRILQLAIKTQFVQLKGNLCFRA